MPILLDIEGLAVCLGTSIRHVRRLVAERRIPYVKVGHYVRFDREEIVRWLDERRVPTFDSAYRSGMSMEHRG
jgi:excisionase family DNA binding protein